MQRFRLPVGPILGKASHSRGSQRVVFGVGSVGRDHRELESMSLATS
jgi:hypothetical protein